MEISRHIHCTDHFHSWLKMQGNRLQGKVAIIAGGASGISERIAKSFLQHGARVIITVDRSADNLDHQCFRAELTKAHCTTFTTIDKYDVTSDSDMKEALKNAISKYEKLDIMVINASCTPNNADRKILGTDYEQFRKAFNVNVHGAFLFAKHASDFMIQKKKGVILFTSDDALVTPEVCPYAYAMSKTALVGLAYNLSAELGKKNIRVSYISGRTPAAPSPKIEAGTKKKKQKAEGTVIAWENLKEVVVEAENVGEEAVNLSSDVPAAEADGVKPSPRRINIASLVRH